MLVKTATVQKATWCEFPFHDDHRDATIREEKGGVETGQASSQYRNLGDQILLNREREARGEGAIGVRGTSLACSGPDCKEGLKPKTSKIPCGSGTGHRLNSPGMHKRLQRRPDPFDAARAARRLLYALGLGFGVTACAATLTPDLQLGSGSRVAVVGDGLAVGMARHGYLEAALHLAFPRQNLIVRCMAREGFRVDDGKSDTRQDDLDAKLDAFGPDLIVVCVGSNESFDGPGAASAFEAVLRERCRRWGRAAPGRIEGARIELVTPLADPSGRSRHHPYLIAMRDCASDQASVGLVDWTEAFSDRGRELAGAILTDGGLLNRRGHWLLARWLATAWNLPDPPGVVEGGEIACNPSLAENLRQLVRRKGDAWRESGPDREERVRGWDEAIWSSPKPGLSSLWGIAPDPMEPCVPAPQNLGMPLLFQFGADPRHEGVVGQTTISGVDGIEASVWASETSFALWNPVGLRFDPDGRAWVGCAPPGKDSYLARIEDRDRDRHADRQVIAVSGSIHAAGFLPGMGGVYVSSDQGLTWYEDRDDDGIADHSQVMLGGVVRRIGLSWGPCGSVWFRRLIGPPAPWPRAHTETRTGTIDEGQGRLFRWSPGTGVLETCLVGGAGGIGDLRFDSWSEPMIPDGLDGLPVGLDRSGYWVKGLSAAPRQEADPVVPGPWVLLRGGAWPGSWQESCLRAEQGPGQGWKLCLYFRDGTDAGWRWRRHPDPILTQPDPGCSPAAMELGPDGALYLLEARGLETGVGVGRCGRILRIASSGWPPTWPPPAHEGDPATLVQRLRHSTSCDTGGVRLALRRFAPGQVFGCLDSVIAGLGEGDPSAPDLFLEELRLRQAFGRPDSALLERLSLDPNPKARYAVTDALGDSYDRIAGASALLERLCEDENPRVRLGAIRSARRIGGNRMGAIVALAREQRMEEDFRLILEGTIAQVGDAAKMPPGRVERARARSSAELLSGEMTAPEALVLFERNDVPGDGLVRAASVLASRAGRSVERWIVDRLEENVPEAFVANLVKILPRVKGWDLHQCASQLEVLRASAGSGSLRSALLAARIVGAAESGTLPEFLAGETAKGDAAALAVFTACAAVIEHPQVRATLPPFLRAESVRGLTPAVAGNAPVEDRLSPGWERREAASALARKLGDGRKTR